MRVESSFGPTRRMDMLVVTGVDRSAYLVVSLSTLYSKVEIPQSGSWRRSNRLTWSSSPVTAVGIG